MKNGGLPWISKKPPSANCQKFDQALLVLHSILDLKMMYMEWADCRSPTVGDEAVASFARILIAYIKDLSYTPLEPLDLKRLVVLKNKYREACAWLKRAEGPRAALS